MQNVNSTGVQHCPDCGQQLETLWDYPSNEVWCLHCGNRFYRTLSNTEASDSANGHRLLILDDNTSRRDGLTGRFANLGYRVTPVRHPRQALEAASFRRFDVAILSADWPGLDTPALIGKLRWQLGDVKFIVFVEDARRLARSLSDHDVQCVRITSTGELESILEHLVDDLVTKSRLQVAATRWELASVH